MSTEEIIAIIISAVVIGAALIYIIKAKKNGKKCIGCPDSAHCSKGKCCGSCGSCRVSFAENNNSESNE